MMGYNEVANQDLTLGDPFKGGRDRRLRPLVPRPYLSSPTPNHNVNTTCLTGFHHNPTNFHNNHNPSNHHLLTLNNNNITSTRHQPHFEEGKEGTHQVMVSSRWNPTPEQLRALEELYRRGTRTPSAEQIQHITAQLRRYGKIEGKNVFYWFQNHKARERQKRRRQLQLPIHSPPPLGNKIGIEGEQKSCKWAQSSTNKEECDPPIQISSEETGGGGGGGGLTKSNTTTNNNAMISEGWIQFHEFQHNHNNIIISSDKNLLFAGERNSTCHTSTHNHNNMVLQPSSCSCCYPSFSLSSKPNNFPSFITSSKHPNNNINNNDNYGGDMFGERRASSPTLQLFPVVRDDDNNNNNNSNEDDDGDENIENNSSCLTTINNDHHEKGSSVRSSSNGSIVMTSKLLECNNNNPFPYYQFL